MTYRRTPAVGAGSVLTPEQEEALSNLDSKADVVPGSDQVQIFVGESLPAGLPEGAIFLDLDDQGGLDLASGAHVGKGLKMGVAPSEGSIRRPKSYAALPSGDFDFRCKITRSTWGSTGQTHHIASQHATGNRSWAISFAANSTVQVAQSTDGTNQSWFNAGVATSTLGLTPNKAYWFRVTRIAATGALAFYWSIDGDDWVQYGTSAAAPGTLFNANTQLVVNGNGNGDLGLDGQIHYVTMLDGIDGAPLWTFDASQVVVTGVKAPTTFDNWTINGTIWEWVVQGPASLSIKRGEAIEKVSAGLTTLEVETAVKGKAESEASPLGQALRSIFASYPIQAWEYESGTTIVTDKRYPYGDVRRYGCPCNGVDDDSGRLQKVFDVCGLNAVPIIKPPTVPMLLANPVVLRSRATHMYIIKGNETRETGKEIKVNGDYGFVGEGFYAATPVFTEVEMKMTGIVMSCTMTKEVVLFKAIDLYHCDFERSRFYRPYIFLEGSMKVNTRFADKNRVQGIRRAFIASSSTLPGVSRDSAAAAYVSSGYDPSVLANYLVKSLAPESTGVHEYISKSNDSWITLSYFAGATSQTSMMSFLEVDDIDVDVMFEQNWIEFGEYFARPFLRTNTVAANERIHGTSFANNVFQFFFRALEENTNFSAWVFTHNDLTSFSRDKLTAAFPNVVSPKFATKKCGVLVADHTEGDIGVFRSVVLDDNRPAGSDHYIYLDAGNNTGKPHSVIERRTKILPGRDGVTNPIYVRLRVTDSVQSPFLGSWFDLLQNKNYATLPALSDAPNYYINVFNGQMTMVGGIPYLTMLGADGLPKYQALAVV